MSRLNKNLLLGMVILFTIQIRYAAAQYAAIPDTFAVDVTSIKIPVYANEVAGNNFTAFQFDIIYDPEVVVAVGFDKSNTISSGFSVTFNPNYYGAKNHMRLVAGSAYPMNSDGILIYLIFNFVNTGSDSTQLKFDDFMYNEDRNVTLNSGSIYLNTPVGIIPDNTVTGEDDFSIPVFISSVSGKNYSNYKFTLDYDTTYIKATGISTTATLSDQSTVSYNIDTPGKIRVAGTSSGTFEGEGSLVDIMFERTGPAAGTALLELNDFVFNNTDTFTVKAGSVYLNAVNTSIENIIAAVPSGFSLKQNYPNPFNPETGIQFFIPKTTEISLEVYNILGQKIKTLYKGTKESGGYEVKWNGRDNQGKNVSSGIYLYVLRSKNGVTFTRKMTLLR